MNWVKCVPWNKFKGDPNEDGEIPEEKLIDAKASGGGEKDERGEAVREDVTVKVKHAAP